MPEQGENRQKEILEKRASIDGRITFFDEPKSISAEISTEQNHSIEPIVEGKEHPSEESVDELREIAPEKNALPVELPRQGRMNRWKDFLDRHFFAIFLGFLILSVLVTFLRAFVFRTYTVAVDIPCDPEVSACFVSEECDTESGICAEGDIPTISYYTLIERPARKFPEACSHGTLDDPICWDLSCQEGEESCETVFCSAETVPDDGRCEGPGFVIPTPFPEESQIESDDGENAKEEKEF